MAEELGSWETREQEMNVRVIEHSEPQSRYQQPAFEGIYDSLTICSTPAAMFKMRSSLNGTPRISSPTGISGSSRWSSSLAFPIGIDIDAKSRYEPIGVFVGNASACHLKDCQLSLRDILTFLTHFMLRMSSVLGGRTWHVGYTIASRLCFAYIAATALWKHPISSSLAE